jgi:hypothetical protein
MCACAHKAKVTASELVLGCCDGHTARYTCTHTKGRYGMWYETTSWVHTHTMVIIIIVDVQTQQHITHITHTHMMMGEIMMDDDG